MSQPLYFLESKAFLCLLMFVLLFLLHLFLCHLFLHQQILQDKEEDFL
nr:MAG TPA: hypothetical protein [Bacteriophage sp.]